MANVTYREISSSFWRGKRVLLTGHTGFKGAWLSFWLKMLGAEVTGFALPPSTRPSLFELLQLDKLVRSIFGDIREPAALRETLATSQPEIVLHLAAQPIVSAGYSDPVGNLSNKRNGDG